jgi:hypothetical protein
MRKTLPAVVGVLILAMTLSGCGLMQTITEHAEKPTPTPTQSAAVVATQPENIVTIPNGVIGTGTVRSSDGKTTGQLTITKTDHAILLGLKHFNSTDRDQLSLAFADSVISANQCPDDKFQFAFGDPVGTHDATISEDMGLDPRSADPTFLKTFMVLRYPDSSMAKVNGCLEPIVARALIKWTVPDTHPNLVLKDSGAQPAANGLVTTRGGTPFSYTTASGDTWSAIAARFGITANDLTYLNPIRYGNNSPGVAYFGQVLNLSKANRGNSESRHP